MFVKHGGMWITQNHHFFILFLWQTVSELKNDSSAPFAGHSHQLFHVCGILGTYMQIKAIEQDMETRRSWLLDHSIPFTFANSLGAGLLCVVLSLTIIIIYSLPLLSATTRQEKKRGKGPKKAKSARTARSPVS